MVLRRGLAGLAACAALLVAPPARAEIPRFSGTWLTFGPIGSTVWTGPSRVGYGGEVSLAVFDDTTILRSVGVFGQAQAYAEGAPKTHLRWAAGLEASYYFIGAELGIARRYGTGGYDDTTQIHTAVYGTIGLASLSLRVAPSVASGLAQPYPTEVGLTLTLKVPVRLGRPLF